MACGCWPARDGVRDRGRRAPLRPLPAALKSSGTRRGTQGAEEGEGGRWPLLTPPSLPSSRGPLPVQRAGRKKDGSKKGGRKKYKGKNRGGDTGRRRTENSSPCRPPNPSTATLNQNVRTSRSARRTLASDETPQANWVAATTTCRAMEAALPSGGRSAHPPAPCPPECGRCTPQTAGGQEGR